MREVICNTSPIQYLHQLGALDLLRSLAARVTVPVAVIDELAAGRECGVDLPDLTALEWLDVRRAQNEAPRSQFANLGPGETEVLMLGVQSPDAVLVLDDALARLAAQTAGLRLTGTLGILLAAKRAGLIPSVQPLLNRLQVLGFRLAAKTRVAVLHQAGEADR